MAWMMNDRVGSPLGSCPWRTHAAAPSFHTECHRPPRSYSDCTVLPSSSLSALSQRVTNTIRCLITVLIAPNYWFTVSLSEWTCVCARERVHSHWSAPLPVLLSVSWFPRWHHALSLTASLASWAGHAGRAASRLISNDTIWSSLPAGVRAWCKLTTPLARVWKLF